MSTMGCASPMRAELLLHHSLSANFVFFLAGGGGGAEKPNSTPTVAHNNSGIKSDFMISSGFLSTAASVERS